MLNQSTDTNATHKTNLILGYAGTFDVFTNGHAAVVEEALEMADKVHIFISSNPQKNPSMSDEKRKSLIDRVCAARNWSRVETHIVKKDYTARVAKRLGVNRMIRGLRNTADFEAENLLQMTNVEVIANLKTVFIIPPLTLGSVSSSFVRSLVAESPVGWHWKVRRFIPNEIYEQVRLDWLAKQWAEVWVGLTINDHKKKQALDSAFQEIVGPGMYGDPSRPYHNLDHLIHGLSEIDAFFANNIFTKNGIKYTDEDKCTVKKAFFLHDVFTHKRDDGLSPEEASAQYAEKLLMGLFAYGDIPAVPTLIRITDHLQGTVLKHPLSDVLIGADLAILGQGTGYSFTDKDDYVAYDFYKRNVRKEYAQYSDKDYAAGRTRVLLQLIEKAKRLELFNHPYFVSLYNDSAIGNMENEIADFLSQM